MAKSTVTKPKSKFLTAEMELRIPKGDKPLKIREKAPGWKFLTRYAEGCVMYDVIEMLRAASSDKHTTGGQLFGKDDGDCWLITARVIKDGDEQYEKFIKCGFNEVREFYDF